MADGKVLHVTKGNFDSLIKDNGIVLLDFWAPWCGPCRAVAPVMDQLAEKYEGKAVIGKVNVDEETELASKFSVMSIPTVMLFKNGSHISKDVGARSLEAYSEMIEKHG